MPGSDQFDPWRVDGIVRGTAEQEKEETTLIRRVKGAGDEGVNLWRQKQAGLISQSRHLYIFLDHFSSNKLEKISFKKVLCQQLACARILY